MAKTKNNLRAIFAALGMLILILDAKTSLSSALEGLELCIRTVIPSLFPFIFLSSILTASVAGRKFRLLHRVFRFFRIGDGCEGLFLVGILGGYPVGAQCVEQAFLTGNLSRRNAARMVTFCNNCGPAFIFGIAAALFEEIWIPWALWGIQIISALLTAKLLPGGCGTALPDKHESESIVSALNRAIRVICGVCAWVILFRMVLAFLDRWFLCLLPTTARTLICGLLELTNGCVGLSAIENTGSRFLLCAIFFSFGGLCVSLQTQSVAQQTFIAGIYYPGKLIQCCISILLTCIVQSAFFETVITRGSILIIFTMLTIISIFLHKKEKSSSIPQSIRV